ncbi:MAG: GNAT family N-acetyltransferase [Candidatus Pacebacteria bacterium]|nr:GNAT family N-acetyltransferase [Candidatus Paceibacterota bacterium]
MKGPLLKSKRISIGPASVEKDSESLAKYFNQVKHYLGAETVDSMTLEKEKEFIQKANDDKSKYFFVIRLLETDTVIGSISIMDIKKYDGFAETGTMIGESFTNQGYGTEAKHLLLDFAFNVLDLRKLYSKVYAYNERSRTYSLKCGYRQIATLPDKKFYNEKYWDEWILEITKEDWIPAYKNYKKKYLE